MLPSASLLEIRGLCRSGKDGNGRLLDDVSLEIRESERVAIAGPSGAGKTVLLRSMVFLDPIDRGEIRWRGFRLQHSQVPGFRREAMYLHQRPSLGEETVEATMRQPFSFEVHRDRRFDRGRILAWLGQLGRDETFMEKELRDLSGGEIQIAALVRALQLAPTLLLLDEPTASLDGATAAAVENLLNGWVSESPGRAMVWVGHDATQARRMTDRSIVLRDGKVVGA
ncbi:MAG: ATP-binding cassette domain-containing protein [Rhodopirellula sp.]|nr:ATP-binding cassette domain-containing protein [Rhodopirellula sp.]